MRLIALSLVLAAAAPVVAAPPPSPPSAMPAVQGRDQVLLGRLYWREGGQTQPLARFGMVLADKPATQVVTAKGPAGTVALSVTAKRGGGESPVSWSLQPGSGVPAAQGRLVVREGSVGHCPLGQSAGGELFAQLETGRASALSMQRLWEHFGVVTESDRLAAAREEKAARAERSGPVVFAPAPAPAPAPAAPRATAFTLTCPSGSAWDLSTGTDRGRCETTIDGDRITGGTCDDGDGNSARASCTVNAGAGSCVSVTGAGSCSKRR